MYVVIIFSHLSSEHNSLLSISQQLSHHIPKCCQLCTCTYVHNTYIYMYMYIYTYNIQCMHVHVYMYIHVHTLILHILYMYMYVHKKLHVHVHIHIRLYLFVILFPPAFQPTTKKALIFIIILHIEPIIVGSWSMAVLLWQRFECLHRVQTLQNCHF